MPGLETYMPYLNWIAVALGIAASIAAALHALFNKRDPRSAAAWIAICLMWPVVGALFYLTFGKNRIKTRARQLHGSPEHSIRARTRDPITMNCTESLLPGYQGLANLSAVSVFIHARRSPQEKAVWSFRTTRKSRTEFEH